MPYPWMMMHQLTHNHCELTFKLYQITTSIIDSMRNHPFQSWNNLYTRQYVFLLSQYHNHNGLFSFSQLNFNVRLYQKNDDNSIIESS